MFYWFLEFLSCSVLCWVVVLSSQVLEFCYLLVSLGVLDLFYVLLSFDVLGSKVLEFCCVARWIISFCICFAFDVVFWRLSEFGSICHCFWKISSFVCITLLLGFWSWAKWNPNSWTLLRIVIHTSSLKILLCACVCKKGFP